MFFHCKVLAWRGLSVLAFSLPFLASIRANDWEAGVSKNEITPKVPIRLSGYGNRTTPTSDIDDPLWVRALYLKHNNAKPLLIVSIDAIGIASSMTQAICESVQSEHGLSRSQIALCTTHSHTAPQLHGVLTNLLGIPQSDEQKMASQTYTEELIKITLQTIGEAIRKAQPVSITLASDQANFAVNRRIIQNNSWVNFGVVEGGLVDRQVRVLKVVDQMGKPIAVAYQYACHCTSVSPEHNRISGDWAGLSASAIESSMPNTVALPIIGCGADANPNPRGEYAHAVAHGKEMAAAVLRAVKSDKQAPLPAPVQVAFGYVGLEFERPSNEKLEAMSQSTSPQERQLANNLRQILTIKDRIPESYPMPMHFWSFGDTLAWIFMGGEVVVDYQVRLERELSQFKNVWVAAYVDDVFGYVVSERVKHEGGYEVNTSTVYYNQPGPWVSGTEDKLVKAILDLQRQERSLEEPLDKDASLRAIQVAKGWKIEQVAAEPLVQDPINISFGRDGKVWVLEMGDYPSGGDRTGQLKCLIDSDGDGKLDKSHVFMGNLPFASGVYAWRDGVVIACAPEVFFARDTDDDGVADEKRVLLSGFSLANPQHRVHGFTYGLDHKLYFGSGDGTHVATLHQLDGQSVSFDIRGGDLALDPDRHELSVETGETQFIRSHDGWDNWFGNDNTHPIYHFVYDRNWIQPNAPRPRSFDLKLTTPASSPEVYPLSQPLDRFNDPYTASRFTSVCSTIINQSPGCGQIMLGDAIVCEPVHNLVARFRMAPSGITWKAKRHEQDSNSEWIRSSDPWFRPVRVVNAPDGSIWIVDMYRRVIEHPTWIPEEWLARLDVRAGKDQGRIYRICEDGYQPRMPAPYQRGENRLSERIDQLGNPVVALADLAQQNLIWDEASNPELVVQLEEAQSRGNAECRLRCFAILHYLKKLEVRHWKQAIADADPRISNYAIRKLARESNIDTVLLDLVAAQSKDPDKQSSAVWCMGAFYLLSNHSDRHITTCNELLIKHADKAGFDSMVDFVANERVGPFVKAMVASDNNQHEIYLNRLVPRISSAEKEEIAKMITSHVGERPVWHFLLARQISRDSDSKAIDARTMDVLHREAGEIITKLELGLPRRTAALDFFFSRLTGESIKEIDKLIGIAQHAEVDYATRIVNGIFKLGDTGRERLLAMAPGAKPNLRSSIISLMISTSVSTSRLVDELEANRLSKDMIEPSQLEILRSNRVPELRNRVIALFGKDDRTNRLEAIADYSSRWPASIQADLGQPLYDQHCAKCHRTRKTVDGLLPAVGPPLQALNHWTNDAWIVAILDPSRSVDSRYRRLIVRLLGDEVLSGTMLSETEEEMELVLTDGRIQTVKKSDIDQIKASELSLMPDGFEKLLTAEQLAQIVTYLRRGGD